MKIGAFAKKNNVSIDTLRHYMEINLLLPLKNGSQYDFDDNCQRDMDEIQELKALRFSLKEIHMLIDYFRLSGLTDKDYKKYISKELLKKKNDLLIERSDLTTAIIKIEEQIEQLEAIAITPTSAFGIHIGMIIHLACPVCKKSPLNLDCRAIDNNMIYEGSLHCSCGHQLIIKDGILIGESHVRELYQVNIKLDDYIKETGDEIIANIRKSIDWFNDTISPASFTNKCVLEIGSGSGFFIRSAGNHIKNAQYYIAIDHDITRHRFLKEQLEASGQSLPIQFICCDYKKIPLKSEWADILIDFTGTSNIAFDTPEFMLNHANYYLNKNCALMASYIIFDKFSTEHFLPLENRFFFSKSYISSQIEKHGFKISNQLDGYVQKIGGPYENYFGEKDKVYKSFIYAKR
jgi:DNA-binding transcriptional MerR regulator